MGQVQQHAGRFQRPQQGTPPGRQAPRGLGPVGIAADAVVAQAHHPQTFIPPLRDLFGGNDAVGSLHGEDEPQGRGSGIPAPVLQMGLQPPAVPNLAEHALGLHQAVVGQFAAALGVGDILVSHAGEALPHRRDAAGNRNEKEPYVSPALLFVVDHVEAPALLGHAGFRFPDRGNALQQVPVPFKGIVSNIDVGIDNQHQVYSLPGSSQPPSRYRPDASTFERVKPSTGAAPIPSLCRTHVSAAKRAPLPHLKLSRVIHRGRKRAIHEGTRRTTKGHHGLG